jgi:integrase
MTTTGHIRRRGERSWELKFDLGRDPATGRRTTRHASFKGTKRQAQAELTRLLAARDAGADVDPTRQTVEQFLTRWLGWAATNVGPKTCERYRDLVRTYVLPRIGAMPVQKLRPTHLVELYATLQSEGSRNGTALSPRTVGHVHRVLRRALGHAVTWNVISTNPAASVKPPQVEHEEVSTFSPDEVGAILDHLKGRTLRAIVAFLIGTGARRGEALALRWSDVDLDGATVRIERSLEQTTAGLRIKSPKTKHGRRLVAIGPSVVAELRAHRTRQLDRRLQLGMAAPAGDDLVFGQLLTGAPRAPHGVSRQFRIALRALKLDGSLHSLRHTHASQLIASGIDLLTIGRRIGHSSPAITLAVYGHLVAGTDAKAAAVLENVFGESRGGNPVAIEGLKGTGE